MRWRRSIETTIRIIRREAKTLNTGRIVQVVGPVVDIEFPPKSMPAILNA
ncbi:hypothetical protein, partial [Phascolarctobacterium sp.]